MKRQDKNEIKATVRRYYGSIAARDTAGCGCKPSSCCEGVSATSHLDQEAEKLGYTQQDVQNVPAGTNLGLGCGNPTALASLKPGETALDLGSGAGFDCLLAAQRVGEKGFIIGVDFASQMIEKARVNAAHGGYTNVEFRLGEIEHLPVADDSIDVIISNCVINLSPEKSEVFKEAFRVLKPGGRLAVSDIVATRRLPDEINEDEGFYCSCISGAASIDELHRMISEAGFESVRVSVVERSREFIREWVTGIAIDEFVASASIEAFKPALKDQATNTSSKEYFDDVASEWDELRREFFPDSVREKAAVAAGVKPGSVAADIGAGSGFITDELLRHGARVIAIDQSEAMLEVMKLKYGAGGSVDFRIGESEKLPVDDNSVDYAFANMYLHHVEAPARAIKEMARILKPGGKLVITDLDQHEFEFLRTKQHDRWMGFKREDVQKWLSKAGLKDVTVDCVGDTCCATSEAGQEEAQVTIFIASGTRP
jgi:ubiquinone/menaquinone biosynthesis C-methylase UbiE